MSNFIKYYTNPTFNKPEFVRVLRYSMNVKAAAVDTEQLYIIRDNYYNEYDRVTAKEWDRLNAEIPGRYDLLGKEPAV